MRKADNLPPSCAMVTKSGNLNFLEPSGPVQACSGTAFYLYSPYEPYGLYRASVPVQGCTLPYLYVYGQRSTVRGVALATTGEQTVL